MNTNQTQCGDFILGYLSSDDLLRLLDIINADIAGELAQGKKAEREIEAQQLLLGHIKKWRPDTSERLVNTPYAIEVRKKGCDPVCTLHKTQREALAAFAEAQAGWDTLAVLALRGAFIAAGEGIIQTEGPGEVVATYLNPSLEETEVKYIPTHEEWDEVSYFTIEDGDVIEWEMGQEGIYRNKSSEFKPAWIRHQVELGNLVEVIE